MLIYIYEDISNLVGVKMKKKIMILGASILQLPAIVKAKEMGLQVIAVDMDPNAIGFCEEGIIKEVISTIDISAVLECARKHDINAIMTLASDMPMRTVAAVAKDLHLVGIDESTALKATNKAVMRQCLYENDVPVPKFFKVSNEAQYMNAVSQFEGAFIVKPADNSGSRGVYLVENHTDKDVVNIAYKHSRKYSRNGDVVVEEFMRGPEVSVESLTVDGECHIVQITDKLTTGAPHFVEMGHSQPTQLTHDIAERICEITKAATKAIGISNGPSHTEIIVTEEGPKIVELGARLGGDCITTHLVPLSTGVDMVKCCIDIALGNEPDIQKKVERGAAIRYFKQKQGIIKSISGINDAMMVSGVCEINLIRSVGDDVADIESSAARMGFVISTAEDAFSAIKVAEKAIDKIKIEIS